MPAQAAPVFPDLQTFEPRDLQFQERDPIEETEPCPPATPLCRPPGPKHNLLRFTNTVFNGGEGKLEVYGSVTNPGQPGSEGPAFQRIFDENGEESSTENIGRFYWHAAHSHYHFDDWGSYQLWTKADYDAWRAHDPSHPGHEDEASRRGMKTTSCVMDEEFIGGVENTPFPGRYPSGGCTPNAGGLMRQGLSPGWGDTYDYYRAEQWIDLGPTGSPGSELDPGRYVLRSVTDPKNVIYESANKADDSRESIYNEDDPTEALGNEATYEILIDSAGRIVDQKAPSGTVAINDVDESTPSRAVNVKVIGRDDVADVGSFVVGNTAAEAQAEAAAGRWRAYTGTGSTPHAFNWTLDAGPGTKTVHIVLRDGSGKTARITDTIELEAGGVGDSDYSNEVLEDSPAGYWRLGETGGTVAANSAGSGNTGSYQRGPQLGQASLVPSETNLATRFNAASRQHVRVPHSGSLNPGSELTVEAWIKPDEVPAGFATVAAKPGAYALQFNAGQLEFKVDGESNPARAVAPAGAIQAGRAYHVVGTYDGTAVRLYVEGQLVNSVLFSEDPASSPDSFHIAAWRGEVEFLSGTVDDVAVYPQALSGQRVTDHREAAKLPPPPPPPPVTVNAPTGLGAVAKSASTIQLNWADKSNNESEFVIQRSTSPSFASPKVFSTEANDVGLLDTGLSPNTTYYYRVKAHLAAALVDSAWSNVASAKTASAGGGGGVVKPPVIIPPTPEPVFPAAKVSWTGTKAAIRTDRKGRLTYTFRVTGGTSGMAKFLTRKAVRTSSKSKRKRHVTFLAKAFKVPRSGKVVLKLKLSKKGFAILKRNKTVYLKVRVGAYGKGPAKLAEKRLTLKAPKPKR